MVLREWRRGVSEGTGVGRGGRAVVGEVKGEVRRSRSCWVVVVPLGGGTGRSFSFSSSVGTSTRTALSSGTKVGFEAAAAAVAAADEDASPNSSLFSLSRATRLSVSQRSSSINPAARSSESKILAADEERSSSEEMVETRLDASWMSWTTVVVAGSGSG